jgi:hypothetical protein
MRSVHELNEQRKSEETAIGKNKFNFDRDLDRDAKNVLELIHKYIDFFAMFTSRNYNHFLKSHPQIRLPEFLIDLSGIEIKEENIKKAPKSILKNSRSPARPKRAVSFNVYMKGTFLNLSDQYIESINAFKKGDDHSLLSFLQKNPVAVKVFLDQDYFKKLIDIASSWYQEEQIHENVAFVETLVNHFAKDPYSFDSSLFTTENYYNLPVELRTLVIETVKANIDSMDLAASKRYLKQTIEIMLEKTTTELKPYNGWLVANEVIKEALNRYCSRDYSEYTDLLNNRLRKMAAAVIEKFYDSTDAKADLLAYNILKINELAKRVKNVNTRQFDALRLLPDDIERNLNGSYDNLRCSLKDMVIDFLKVENVYADVANNNVKRNLSFKMFTPKLKRKTKSPAISRRNSQAKIMEDEITINEKKAINILDENLEKKSGISKFSNFINKKLLKMEAYDEMFLWFSTSEKLDESQQKDIKARIKHYQFITHLLNLLSTFDFKKQPIRGFVQNVLIACMKKDKKECLLSIRKAYYDLRGNKMEKDIPGLSINDLKEIHDLLTQVSEHYQKKMGYR